AARPRWTGDAHAASLAGAGDVVPDHRARDGAGHARRGGRAGRDRWRAGRVVACRTGAACRAAAALRGDAAVDAREGALTAWPVGRFGTTLPRERHPRPALTPSRKLVLAAVHQH